jgi:hypothetical protein
MDIPGTELPSFPDVDAAGEKFVAHRRSHAKSGKKLRDLRLELVKEMQKAKVKEYRDDEAQPPLLITLEDDTKVHVKELKHEERKPKEEKETKLAVVKKDAE